MLPCASFIEECGKGVIIIKLVGFGLEGAIWLDGVFQTEQLPACITNLNSSLSNMNRDAFTLWEEKIKRRLEEQETYNAHLSPPPQSSRENYHWAFRDRGLLIFNCSIQLGTLKKIWMNIPSFPPHNKQLGWLCPPDHVHHHSCRIPCWRRLI